MLLMRSRSAGPAAALLAVTALLAVNALITVVPRFVVSARADCPAQAAAQVYTGTGGTPCPCFVSGEEAGTVFSIPSGDYPIQVLRVGLLWASQFGGSPQQLEESIKIYEGGLPNPGLAVAELPGPVLNDGFLNEYDLENLYPTDIIINTGPVTATLKFLNENSGDLFAPSVCYDSGCHAANNLVYAIPGGWSSACGLGVPGDWIFYLVYKPCAGQVGIGDEVTVASRPVMLFPPNPNPIRLNGTFDFFLAEPGHASIQVFDVAGRPVATLADETFGAGANRVTWTPDPGLSGGVYFVELIAPAGRSTAKVLVER